MGMLLAVFFVGFLVGVFTVIGFECLGIWLLIVRLNQKTRKLEKLQSESGDLDYQQSLDSLQHKQGDVWVLEAEKIPKNWLEKLPRDQKRKRDYIEVSPVRKHAIIKDHWLIITETDGSPTTVQLKGCKIEAVSATNLPSRKWAKRFPVKLESETSEFYRGSKFFYIYLETSWEKESWCKALRLAACDDKKRHFWCSRLQEEFKSYLITLHDGYPTFLKPSGSLYAESTERENRMDNNPSKVRLIWKKLTRKVSKAAENRSSGASLSGREERKTIEKLRPYQFSVPATYSMGAATLLLKAAEENYDPQLSSSLPHTGSQSHVSVASEAYYDDNLIVDGGTLCWNLLISRLFFDMKNNDEIRRSIQARIQRTLSNMRIPSYIGEVVCTGIGTGNLPPHFHGMRILPADMNETWAFEVDIEYNGGAVLDIEMRLRELDMVDQHIESNAVDNVSANLLEDFEYLGKQLNLSEEKVDKPEPRGEQDPKTEGLKHSKSNISASNYKSKLKTMLNTVAKQVAQVPISLQIKVASLRGTLQVHVKPPPSDQLWYGFTSMPEIEFNLESSVGDHKITSGHIALFLINRFKASIRDTMVLPNCESICISWMLSEKDDWAPRKAAPFIWLNQETTKDTTSVHDKPSPERKSKSESGSQSSSNNSESRLEKIDDIERSQSSIRKSSDTPVPKSSSTGSLKESGSFSDLTTPLIMSNESPEGSTRDKEVPIGESSSRYISLAESRDLNLEDDDSRPKKMGRRARMLDLGKKMGEKLEEKRRQMEEKSRHIVEKMRGPQDNKT